MKIDDLKLNGVYRIVKCPAECTRIPVGSVVRLDEHGLVTTRGTLFNLPWADQFEFEPDREYYMERLEILQKEIQEIHDLFLQDYLEKSVVEVPYQC